MYSFVITIFLIVFFVGSSFAFSVGTTNVEYEVNSEGFTWKIPLFLAPTRNNMPLDIAIRGSSSSDSHESLGRGVFIDGLAVITRCPQTKFFDKNVTTITGTKLDRFCMGGDRLVVIKGEYGELNSEYYFDVHTQTKIILTAVNDLGQPLSFLMLLPNGNSWLFGYTEDSRHPFLLFWSVNRKIDSNRNYVDFKYNSHNLIDTIVYTGHLTLYLTPLNIVKFTYRKSTNIPWVSFVNGIRVENSMLLENITTFVGSKFQECYFINYTESSDSIVNTKLTSVTRCSILGNQTCLPPIVVSWNASPENITFKSVTGNNLPKYSKLMFFGDFNGDGLTDIYLFNVSVVGECVDSVYIRNNSKELTFSQTSGISSTIPYASPFWLSSAVARYVVADLNGDGRDDIYVITGGVYDYSKSSCDQYANDQIFLSKPDGSFSQKADWQGPQTFISCISLLYSNLNIKQINVIDLNGDGIADIYQSYSTGNDIIWINNNNGTFTKAISVTSFMHNQLHDAELDIHRLRFSDVNGDGLVDMVRIIGWEIVTFQIFYNRGGFENSLFSMDPINLTVTFKISRVLYYAKQLLDSIQILDINRDGLPDILYLNTNTAQIDTLMNNGNNTFSIYPGPNINSVLNQNIKNGIVNLEWMRQQLLTRLVYQDFNGDGFIDIFLFNGYDDGETLILLNSGNGYTFTKFIGPPIFLSSDTLGIRNSSNLKFGDWNGDGMVDFLFVAVNGNDTVFENPFERANIISLTDGLSNIVTLDYSYSSEVYETGSAVDYPIIDHAVGRLFVSRITETSSLGMSKTSYRYKGLKYHIAGIGYLGFETFYAFNSVSNSTEIQHFLQSWENRLSRTIKAKEILFNDLLVESTTYTYSSTKVNNYFILSLISQNSTKYGLYSEVISNTISTYIYDNYQQLINSFVTIMDSIGSYFVSRTIYIDNNESAWVFGKQTRILEEKQTKGFVKLSKDITYTYDINNNLATETSFEGTLFEFKKEFFYDLTGNIVEEWESGFNFTRSMVVKRTFDQTLTFVLSEKNCYGHTVTKTIDPYNGLDLTMIDQNGVMANIKYDAFGRKVRTDFSDGTFSSENLYWCASLQNITSIELPGNKCFKGAVFYVNSISKEGVFTITYYSSLSKPIAIAERGAFDRWLVTLNEFDSLYNIIATSLPFFSNSSDIFWFNYTYDGLQRKTEVLNPDQSYIRYSYFGCQSTSTNFLNQTSAVITNSLGLETQFTDASGNSMYYYYDSFGNLVRIDGYDGYRVLMEYDINSNVINITEPNIGTVYYRRDVKGNEIYRKDNNGTEMFMKYDSLSRLIERTVYTTRSTSEIHTWEYDNSKNGIGKITSVSTNSSGTLYKEVYQYDTFSREISISIITDNLYFSINKTYNSQSQIQSLTFPNGYSIFYTYNYNNLVLITDKEVVLWKLDSKNEQNKVERETILENIKLFKSFDILTGRIIQVQSWKDLVIYQNTSLSWDSIGNLVEKSNYLLNNRERFTYDILNRLTQVYTELADSQQYVPTLEMKYGASGNILYKSDVGWYKYHQTKTHAVDSAGNFTFVYDRNGNLIFESSTNKKYIYNSLNKLVQVITDKSVETFEYDGKQQITKHRVLKYSLLSNPTGIALATIGCIISVVTIIALIGLVIAKIKKKVSMLLFVVLLILSVILLLLGVGLVAGGFATLWSENITVETTTFKVGSFFEYQIVKRKTTTYEERCNIGPNIVKVFYWEDTEPKTNYTKIILQDYLGSVETTITGDTIVRYSYDVFGKQNVLTNETAQTYSTAGFGEFLQLDVVPLVHMEGRIYDPILGRFYSPDPTVQNILSTQNHNRYSYVLNNPASLIDENGYGWVKSAWKALGKIVKGVGDAITAPFKGNGKSLLSNAVNIIIRAVSMAVCGPQCTLLTEAITSGVTAKIQGANGAGVVKSMALGVTTTLVGKIDVGYKTKLFVSGTLGYASNQDLSGIVSGVSKGLGNLQQPASMHGIVGEQLVMLSQQVFKGVGTKIAKEIGVESKYFDFALLAASSFGGVRQLESSTGSNFLLGVTTHKAFSIPFDIIDIALVFQGYPSFSGWTIITDNLQANFKGGHSLGAAEMKLLHSLGIIPRERELSLLATPFLSIGWIGNDKSTCVEGDYVCGAMFPRLFNDVVKKPDPTNPAGPHALTNYQANPDRHWDY